MLVGPALAGLALAFTGSGGRVPWRGRRWTLVVGGAGAAASTPIDERPACWTGPWRLGASALPDALDGLRHAAARAAAARRAVGARRRRDPVGRAGRVHRGAGARRAGARRIGRRLPECRTRRRRAARRGAAAWRSSAVAGWSAPLGLGVLLWSLPLAALGLLSSVPAAVALLALAGAGRVRDGRDRRTLLQRVAPVRGCWPRMFGAAGGRSTWRRWRLAPSWRRRSSPWPGSAARSWSRGTAMLLAAATAWPTLRRLDDAAVARPRERGAAALHPDVRATRRPPPSSGWPPPWSRSMPTPAQPWCARGIPATTSTSSPAAGWRSASTAGRSARRARASRSARSPCCATCRARPPSWRSSSTELVALDRTTFLEAVTGLPASAAAAEATVDASMSGRRPRTHASGGRRRCARVTWASSLGQLPTGRLNAITDVAGVRVGHRTLIRGDAVRTGVTVIMPHEGDPASEPVFAGIAHAERQRRDDRPGVDPRVGDADHADRASPTPTRWAPSTTRWSARASGGARRADAAGRRWSLPVVAETWDGYLNDIDGQHSPRTTCLPPSTRPQDGPVAEGNVGGGTGMKAFGFKAGIGTASRLVARRGRRLHGGRAGAGQLRHAASG